MFSRTTPKLLLASLTIFALQPASAASRAPAHPNLRTVAEQSGNRRTGRYEEVERLCPAYQQTWPNQVRCFEFGRTPEGRPMLALVASADGVLDAAAAHRAQRPIVLMQGGIHAGEIDGKDAGFLALREMLEGTAAKGALAAVTFVFVPVFNVDGHERFGRWNRPNQVGPEEMGWRTTAQNLNLNRDYVKADAPEMQAMLRLLNEWDPILYVDLHVTDGAQFEHDVSYNVAPTLAGDADLRRSAVRTARRAAAAHARRRARCRSTSIPRSCATTIPLRASPSASAPKRFSHGVLGGAQPHRRARRDAFLEGLSDARAHHAQLDHRDDGDGRARRPQMAAGGEGRGRAARARSAARASRSAYENTDARAHDRVPRLRIHARAVGDLRRAADALQPEASRRSGAFRCATRCARRSPSTRRAAATSCRQRMRSWSARSWRCTASSSARSTSAQRGVDAETFRATKVTLLAGDVRGPHDR